MSHVAKVDVKFTNLTAAERACKRMNALYCGLGFQKFYDGTEVGGAIIHLPNWEYNMVITREGELVYDNYNGEWGDIEVLNRFKQLYAVECGKLEAENMGYSYQEEELPTGVLKLTIDI